METRRPRLVHYLISATLVVAVGVPVLMLAWTPPTRFQPRPVPDLLDTLRSSKSRMDEAVDADELKAASRMALDTLWELRLHGSNATPAIPAVLEIVQGREGHLADISLRGEAAATLEIIGSAAVPALAECLKHPDPAVRQQAALSLGYMAHAARGHKRMAAWQSNYGPIQLADLQAVMPVIQDTLGTEESPWVQHTLKWAKQTIAGEE